MLNKSCVYSIKQMIKIKQMISELSQTRQRIMHCAQ